MGVSNNGKSASLPPIALVLLLRAPLSTLNPYTQTLKFKNKGFQSSASSKLVDMPDFSGIETNSKTCGCLTWYPKYARPYFWDSKWHVSKCFYVVLPGTQIIQFSLILTFPRGPFLRNPKSKRQRRFTLFNWKSVAAMVQSNSVLHQEGGFGLGSGHRGNDL